MAPVACEPRISRRRGQLLNQQTASRGREFRFPRPPRGWLLVGPLEIQSVRLRLRRRVGPRAGRSHSSRVDDSIHSAAAPFVCPSRHSSAKNSIQARGADLELAFN